MKRIICYFICLAPIFLSGCQSKESGNSDQQEKEKPKSQKLFEIPKPPSMLVVEEERAAYIGAHYWEHFPFADTAMVGRKEEIKPYFTEYIGLLSLSSPETVKKNVRTTLERAFESDSALFALFVELYEHNANGPNSPVRNETLFISALEYIVESDRIDNLYKLRYQKLLDLAQKNRVGQEANDIRFVTRKGEVGRLKSIRSDYTLIFFNNPDCSDCKRVKTILSESEIVNRLIEGKRLSLLAIYPDEDRSAWERTKYPDRWINGCDPTDVLQKEQRYDLKAIPCLYLLDKRKRVILKDAPVESVVQWLSSI